MHRTTFDLPRPRYRAWLALALVLGLAMALLAPSPSQANNHEAPGGPVILMGLDSELTPGQSSHGTPEEHEAMVGALLGAVNNGGEGILVIGDTTNVRNYWKGDVADPLGVPVDFVRGADNIKEVDFSGYAMIGVSSSSGQITGGLTNAENTALISRDVDIAEFVNNGGGLLGKTQDKMSDPFGYVGPLGDFTPQGANFSSVQVTQAGLDLGLTQDGMDGWCCYHEVFETFPDFMEVLITHDGGGSQQGMAAAIGGVNVTIPTGIDLEPSSATLDVGETHELIAIVEQDDQPAEDVEVTFTATDGPHEGEIGSALTDDNGIATLSYEGQAAGIDTVVATFVDVIERQRTSNQVTVEWMLEPAAEGLHLAPETAGAAIGDEHTVTATLVDDDGDPVADAEITFGVTDGPHEGTTATATTDGDGQATFTYEGDEVGTDSIVATHSPDEGDDVTSNTVTVDWTEVLDEVEDQDDVEVLDEAEAAEAVEDDPDYTG